jgi:AcrR family transcriptional regulator
MARKYELKRRGERMEDTRRRIVEAAIDLHRTIGPARTSVSAVAERAGVQRQTYYRHFPDERSLFYACTGLYMERAPMPDPETWRAIADPSERVERGLTELYSWYAENEPMLANVIRDAAISPMVQETVEVGVGAAMSAMRGVLAEALPAGDSARTIAVLDLALDFNTWRTLVRRSGLAQKTAVELMAAVVRCATRP